jgi:F1F0 ATPase subunit 2
MFGFFIGIILGIIFFGGLYLTILKLGNVKNPSILFAVSFMLRMAILLGGLFLLSQNGYQGVLFALLGIILAKFLMIFAVKHPREKIIKSEGGE